MSATSNTLDVDVTRSQCALAATWRTAATSGKAPERYEWSVGVDGEQIGHALLDVLKEPVWREVSGKNMAVYTTGSSRKTGKATKYCFIFSVPFLFISVLLFLLVNLP